MSNLKVERIKRNIKQGELAARVGITPQYLRLLEIGKVDPRRTLMKKLANELQIDIETLFFSDNEK